MIYSYCLKVSFNSVIGQCNHQKTNLYKISSVMDMDEFHVGNRRQQQFLCPAFSSVQFSSVQFSSVKLLSRVWLFVIPWTAANQASLSITNSQSLLKLMSIESVRPSSHHIFCRPLLLLPSIFPSLRVFSNESLLCVSWPKYWSFSFSISSSNEYSGLISFRMDWFDLLSVQGTLKSLFWHRNSKASILQCSALWSSSHMGQTPIGEFGVAPA